MHNDLWIRKAPSYNVSKRPRQGTRTRQRDIPWKQTRGARKAQITVSFQSGLLDDFEHQKVCARNISITFETAGCRRESCEGDRKDIEHTRIWIWEEQKRGRKGDWDIAVSRARFESSRRWPLRSLWSFVEYRAANISKLDNAGDFRD